mmetsp:Transcript_42552/g.121737  ORF Transcript_42552/g.121737 Transcript_42552/m.121737 type:complete len:623 (+) Transcript_42552:55-1923(+)
MGNGSHAATYLGISMCGPASMCSGNSCGECRACCAAANAVGFASGASAWAGCSRAPPSKYEYPGIGQSAQQGDADAPSPLSARGLRSGDSPCHMLTGFSSPSSASPTSEVGGGGGGGGGRHLEPPPGVWLAEVASSPEPPPPELRQHHHDRDRDRDDRGGTDRNRERELDREREREREKPVPLVLHIDEVPMPRRPEVDPASTDREIYVDPLPDEDLMDTCVNAFGQSEEIYRLPVAGANRGYIRFRDHDAAKRAVEAAFGTWSESERTLSSQRSRRSMDGTISTYPDSIIARLVGTGGESIRKLKEECGVNWLHLRGEDLGHSDHKFSGSQRVHFIAEGDEASFQKLREILEKRLADIHDGIRDRLEKEGEGRRFERDDRHRRDDRERVSDEVWKPPAAKTDGEAWKPPGGGMALAPWAAPPSGVEPHAGIAPPPWAAPPSGAWIPPGGPPGGAPSPWAAPPPWPGHPGFGGPPGVFPPGSPGGSIFALGEGGPAEGGQRGPAPDSPKDSMSGPPPGMMGPPPGWGGPPPPGWGGPPPGWHVLPPGMPGGPPGWGGPCGPMMPGGPMGGPCGGAHPPPFAAPVEGAGEKGRSRERGGRDRDRRRRRGSSESSDSRPRKRRR